jgi:putative ABC transport system substrate-binding protein
MKRREFVGLLGGAATWSLAARAQQPGKLSTVAVFVTGTPASHGAWVATFAGRLRDHGWIEGRTVTIEYRWGEGRNERFAEIATELVSMRPDIIVTGGTVNTLAVKQVTSAIPIVFAAAADPVRTGLVGSLARPGGNVTGLSVQQPDTLGKRLELLRETVPAMRRLAIMANAGSRAALAEMHEVQAEARKLGLGTEVLEIRMASDIAPAIDTVKGRVDSLYVVGDPFVTLHQHRINVLALGARLPTSHANREAVQVAGLMSYGPNFADLYRRAGDYVDKILRGAKPADLPIEQPTKFDLIINLITAKALGVTVPHALLARADEVIE